MSRKKPNRVMRIEEVQKRLKFMRPSLVAKATGLSTPTVVAIKDGSNANPVYRVLVALSDFLDSQIMAIPTLSIQDEARINAVLDAARERRASHE